MGVFQRLDRDGDCLSKGVSPVGASSVSTAFKRPQRVASSVRLVSFLSQFILIDSHFLSLIIDFFAAPAMTQAGQEVMARPGKAARITR